MNLQILINFIFKYFLNIILFVVIGNNSLIKNVAAINNRNHSTFDIFTCCSEVFGSCRTSCENLSLVQLAITDSNSRDYKLGEVKKFCPSIQVEFWNCINRTLQAVSRGSQWSGRRCCSLSKSPRCQNACATSSNKDELIYGCRQSDEQHMFTCFEKQEMGDQCCGNARTSECLQACRKIFEDQKQTPSKTNRKYMEEVCTDNNPKVLQCVKSFTDLTPVKNSGQYMPCCELSHYETCRQTCKETLPNTESIEEIIDELENGGCGPPLPHDPLWQCFLSGGKNMYPVPNLNEVSQINQIGMDSAKLHCCPKSVAPKCQRLCVQTFSTDWTSARAEFDLDCMMQSNELELRRCIDEVDEPCELGCDGLSFCTNFNNRPTELFRSCFSHADMAAKSDVAMWQNLGFVSLPGINLPIRNITKCSPETWRAIACALQIRPCTRGSHMNQICREDCYEILSKCMDWTRLETGISAASICSKLSPDDHYTNGGDSTVPCISLKPYLEPSDIPVDTGGHHRLTSPCKGAACNATQVCLSFRNATIGFQCVPGCPLGEASLFWVPFGSYVRIPISSNQKGCLKICRCGATGRIEHCQPLPCFSYDSCSLAGKHIEHLTWFYVECNICSCYAGEITCTKKQCKIPGISDHSFTSLPCNCPAHYVPVCGKNGNTYHSACIAKCTGLQDADLEFGTCGFKDPCQEGAYSCPLGTKCVADTKVCLSAMHRPCLQYQCVNTTLDCVDTEIAACDTFGRTHPSACSLFKAGRNFSHFGTCFQSCQQRKGSVCGINGVTYQSECHAWADYSYADYQGQCKDVGLLVGNMGVRCKYIKCSKLSSENCKRIVPPGACCPICSGAMRIVFSRKQIDRALYALKGKNMEILTLKNILKSLDSLVQITECQLVGFLTMETDLFVAVLSRELRPNHIQISACTSEAEKIATLIATQSHRITSNLILSSLTVANMINPDLDRNSAGNQIGNIKMYGLISLILLFIFH